GIPAPGTPLARRQLRLPPCPDDARAVPDGPMAACPGHPAVRIDAVLPHLPACGGLGRGHRCHVAVSGRPRAGADAVLGRGAVRAETTRLPGTAVVAPEARPLRRCRAAG